MIRWGRSWAGDRSMRVEGGEYFHTWLAREDGIIGPFPRSSHIIPLPHEPCYLYLSVLSGAHVKMEIHAYVRGATILWMSSAPVFIYTHRGLNESSIFIYKLHKNTNQSRYSSFMVLTPWFRSLSPRLWELDLCSAPSFDFCWRPLIESSPWYIHNRATIVC